MLLSNFVYERHEAGDGLSLRTITCSGTCPNLSHAATTSFTLNATAASGSSFIGWTSGSCRGTNPRCTFALTDAVTISATFAPYQAYMFVTSSTVVPGMLGGVEGGDTECQRLADNAGRHCQPERLLPEGSR